MEQPIASAGPTSELSPLSSYGASEQITHDKGVAPCEACKRAFDLLLALLALIPTLPIMLVAGALMRLTSAGPMLYRQIRIGRDEKPFSMLKLRTMRANSDDSEQRWRNRVELLGLATATDGIFKFDHPGITAVGRVLRRFSIDELPQLFNVLRGEMSIVGPRPSLPWEVALFTSEQRARHRCRPGITGLWQVSGRNRLTMPQMLALDIIYVETHSLRLDLSILLRTPAAILSPSQTR